eukprot:m.68095 g.68095  ORF g.68095 m.68095 type:complete len:469 (+) comp13876_c0_seq1:190-1596(+)
MATRGSPSSSESPTASSYQPGGSVNMYSDSEGDTDNLYGHQGPVAPRRSPVHHSKQQQPKQRSDRGRGFGRGRGSSDDKTPLLATINDDDDGARLDDGTELHVQKKAAKPSTWVLLCYVLAFLVMTVASNIARKRMQNAFGVRYVFFRQELTNFNYNVLASIVVVYYLLFTKTITRQMRKFPIWKFAIIGLLDGLSDLLNSIGGVNCPGGVQILLQQLVIPFTMGISYIVFKSRYTMLESAGATLIIGGALLAILPPLVEHKDSGRTLWYAVLIVALSYVPQASSGVFKDHAFRSADLNIFYLTAVVSWTQLGLTWVFAPIQSIPGFGGVKLHDIPEVFRDGAHCFGGDTSIPVYRTDDDTIDGYCSLWVTEITLVYSSCGFIAGIFQLLILKHGSAVMMVLCQAITLPLSNLLFSARPLMKSEVEPFSAWDIGGLVVVLLGFVTYKSAAIRDAWLNRGTPATTDPWS